MNQIFQKLFIYLKKNYALKRFDVTILLENLIFDHYYEEFFEMQQQFEGSKFLIKLILFKYKCCDEYVFF
jgi:hypothetical protein